MENKIPLPSFYLCGVLESSHHNALTKFLKYASNHKLKRITIYINSHGGDSNVTTSIYLKLRAFKQKGVHITSIAHVNVKSGAFLIYLVGDLRLAYKDCQFMYHHHYKPFRLDIKLITEESLNNYILENELFEQAKLIAKNNKSMDDEIMTITGLKSEALRQMNDVDFDNELAIKYNVVHEILLE